MSFDESPPPGASAGCAPGPTVRYLIFDAFGIGGTVRTVLSVANYLVANNYDVEIASLMRWREKPVFPIDSRIRITTIHDPGNWEERRWANWRLWLATAARLATRSKLIHPDDEAYRAFSRLSDRKLARWLKRLTSGVLITTRPSLNLLAAHCVAASVVKLGQEHLHYHAHPERLRIDIRNTYRQLDALVTLTDADRAEYSQVLRDSATRLCTLPNAIPRMEFRPAALDETVVIAAGRFVPQKGFDLLIEAFGRLAPQHPNWKLNIFGSGPDKAQLQRLIAGRSLQGRVFLKEPSAHIEEELAKASVFVVSSRVEGFGMVMIEAMSCGLPVVSFDCPTGPREIIRHGEDGLLVEKENVPALSAALLDLIEHPEKRKRFGVRARENVQRFAMDVIGPKWIELIETLSRGKGAAQAIPEQWAGGIS